MIRKAVPALFLLMVLPLWAGSSNKLVLPRVEQFETGSGIKVYHMKDDLPRTTISAAIGYGSLYETGDTAGLSTLLARTLLMGGTKKYPGNKLNEYIESLGGRISISSSYENVIVSISFLDRYSKEAAEILGEILISPQLDKKHFLFARTMYRDELLRDKDQPFSLALDRVKHEIFGNQGYGVVADPQGVLKLSVQDVRKAWKRSLVSGNLVLAVASCREAAYFKPLLDRELDGIPQGVAMDYNVDNRAAHERVVQKHNTIYFIEKKLPQATIVMGTVAPSRKSNQEYSLSVMNYVLGGGSFNSRLMSDIRVKRGLAYGTGSVTRLRKGTGLFLAYAQTKTSSAPEVISLMSSHIKKIYQEKVPAREVRWASRYLENSYIFQFDTTLKVLASWIDIHYNGLDKGYLTGYQSRIRGVTVEDVQGSARNMLQDGVIIVVAGHPSLVSLLEQKGHNVKVVK